MKKKKKIHKNVITSLHKAKKENKKENIAKKEEIQNEKLGKGFPLLLKNIFRMLALSFSNYVFEYLRWSI